VSKLDGRVAVVTGVSRRAGIGFAVARRLLAEGASVFCQSWSPHDAEQPWGSDSLGQDGVIQALAAPEGRMAHVELDLAEAANAARLVSTAADRFGHVDMLIANHARSSTQSLDALTVEELDRCWAVNARASVLLVQAFAAQHDGRPGGRVVLFTSGQHRAPMSSELPYAISKGAIHQMTLSLADALADRGITVNTVNPGPTDTGWASPELAAQVGRALPRGRWNTPDEIAAVVAWLVSDDAATLTGDVIDAEAGFRRWAM
jgi:NAD(P)-dependent dehydrogenase (short-subunit alcohol dehydrogenase family)